MSATRSDVATVPDRPRALISVIVNVADGTAPAPCYSHREFRQEPDVDETSVPSFLNAATDRDDSNRT